MDIKITSEMMYSYLSLSSEWRIRVWSDGSWDSEKNDQRARCEVLNTDDDPYVVASVNCPGIENLDSSYFTTDFVEYDEDNTGTYFEIETGRKVGELEDVIYECVRDGDLSNYFDDLEARLEEAMKN